MKAWQGWTFLAVACWGVWAVIPKFIGESLSAVQQQALSTLGALPVILELARREWRAGQKSAWTGLLIAFLAGIFTNFGNITYFGLMNSDANVLTVLPLTALYPVVTIVLGLLFLRERLNPFQKIGVILSFVAIYLFNFSADANIAADWVLAALIPILLWGLAGFLQKIATNYISGERSTLLFLLAFVPMGGVLLLGDPVKVSPPPAIWIWVTLLGLTLAFGNFAILQAFARGGKASVIAPVGGLYFMVSIPLAMIIFREKPGWREIVGIVISCAAVACLAMESKTQRDEKNN